MSFYLSFLDHSRDSFSAGTSVTGPSMTSVAFMVSEPGIGLLFLPPATQRLVKSDHGKLLVPLSAGQTNLGREELLLGFENFVITGFAGKVSFRGDPDGSLQRRRLRAPVAREFPPSRWRRTNASETSRKAVSAVCWKRSRASSRAAWAWRYWPTSRPPSKSGPAPSAATPQALAPPRVKADNSGLILPSSAVKPIVGKNSATDSPICALAERSNCSACRTSGRRSSSADGKPAGTSGGSIASSGQFRPVDRPGIAPQQNAKLIFRHGNLFEDRRRGGMPRPPERLRRGKFPGPTPCRLRALR